MNITAKSIHTLITASALSGVLGAALVSSNVQASTTNPPQSSIDNATISEGYTLSKEAGNASARSAQTRKLGNFHHQSQDRPQVWIGDIGTLLFDDLDGDGFHSGFSVTIDVDSEYGDTEVYAKIYLEPSDTASVLLHTTEQFSIYGTTVGDEYRVDTELRNNYVADNYSVSIDIHDAWTDELLDTANERGFNNLKQLPLESSEMNQYDEAPNQHNNDAGHPSDDHEHDDDDYSDDIVVTEYAGSFHPTLLLILVGAMMLRRRKC